MTMLFILLACLHVIVCLNNSVTGSDDNQEFQNMTEEQNVSSPTPTVEIPTTLVPTTVLPSRNPTMTIHRTDSELLEPWLTKCESCSCNRTFSCDVGCCCDKDCTPEDKMSFTRCENYVSSIHQRHCLRSNILFRNSSGYNLINTTDGLFCVVPVTTENTPCYKQYEILRTAKQFNRVSAKNGKPLRTSTGDEPRKLPEAKHGQPIIIENNGEYKFLGFPGSVAGKCAGVDPVLYLMDNEITCSSPIPLAGNCETHPLLNAATFYKNFSVVMDQKYLPIKPCVCSSTGECQRGVQSPAYNSSTGTCLNMVSHVQYTIVYDGSGIESISAFFVLEHQVADTSKLQNWYQTFKVAYKRGNNSNANECELRYSQPALTRSGNPGYVLGAPILVGRLTGSRVNIESRFMIVQPVTNGLANCNLTNVITFGEGMKSGCTLSITPDAESSSTTCDKLNLITSQLFNISVDRIGVFGNASPNRNEDWIPLLQRTLSKITQVSDPNKHSSLYFYDTCEFVTDVQLTIAVARVGHKTNPQSKIVGARLTKTKIRYLVMCRQLSCNAENHSVHVTFGILFVDVSGSKV